MAAVDLDILNYNLHIP